MREAERADRRERKHPMGAALHDGREVGAVDVACYERAPELDHTRHAELELGRMGRERDGIDSADRRAHDDRESILAVRHDFRDGPEGAGLIGASGATAR